jgi:glycosyltransferase involved in cell wall biosynthesis
VRVSVAICTWNRAVLLRQTLEQFCRLQVPPDLRWELIVVNNNCTDQTDEVVADFSNRLPLRRLSQPRPGKSHAVNMALGQALGQYVLFTDDDVLVDERWLVAFETTSRRYPDAAVAGGPIEPWFVAEPSPLLTHAFPALASGFNALDHGLPEGPLPPGRYVWGANLAVNRNATGDLLFDPTLGPAPGRPKSCEEMEFIDRVRTSGGSVVWSPAMRVRHYVDPQRMTLRYLTRYYAGIGANTIRLEGVPAGSRIAGVPRWLIRRTVETYIRHVTSRIRGRESEALVRLREFSELRGMVGECLARARRSSQTATQHARTLK